MRKFILLCVVCVMLQSCRTTENVLTEAQIQDIADTAKEVVKKVFDFSNNMDFESGLNYYSPDTNSYYITDGVIHTLPDLKKTYKQIGPSVESLHNTIEKWNVKVLSPDLVTFTLPVTLKLKLKGIPEFSGQLVWTATLQKQKGQWLIVQSHESWLNCAEVAAALIPTGDI